MFKVLTILIAICAFSTFSYSQDDDYKKNEVFVGFSHQNVGDLDFRRGFNGFNASYVRNVSRFFGVKGDVSGAYKGFNSIGTGTGYTLDQKDDQSVYNFLGGVQIKDNASKKRLQPFAHALIGVGHNRSKVDSRCASGNCPANRVFNRTFHDTGFAGAFGGGLDIKVNDKISVRAIQVDYNPIYSNTRVDQNVRFGFGIVFK